MRPPPKHKDSKSHKKFLIINFSPAIFGAFVFWWHIFFSDGIHT